MTAGHDRHRISSLIEHNPVQSALKNISRDTVFCENYYALSTDLALTWGHIDELIRIAVQL